VTRFVYNTATTLNGFIATRDNSLDWLFAVDSPESVDFEGFLEGIGALVLGSTTYEWVYDHEGLGDSPGKWKEFYGDRPAFVFTTRELPLPADADIRLVSGEVRDHTDAIAEAAGDGDVWVVGGGELAGQFLDAGALDEIQITFAPAALAEGAPLFPREIGSDRLRLRSARQVGQFAHLTYEIAA
jgi:dihydrofolate reductase